MAIKPTSLSRALLYVSLGIVLSLLAGSAGLVLWQYVIIIIVSALVTIYLALSKPILLHITQPPISQRLDQNWQLLMRTSRSDELWQSSLKRARHLNRAIFLSFEVVEPRKRNLRITIFRDQVNTEQWRQLSLLAHSVESK